MRYTEEQKRIFGKNVWVRRNLLNMSTKELAKAYGCTSNMVNVWERGESVPPRDRMKDLARILKCSIHDLHRAYNIPKFSFTEANKIIEKKEEPVMSDEELVKAASEVFENAYVETTEGSKGHPVVDRINKYMVDNHISQSELARRIPMSLATLNRVVHGMLLSDNFNYARVEEYLDSIEEANIKGDTENTCQLEIKFDEPIEEQVIEEPKAEEKGSISDRMNCIYNTLFNALDELDKLKADIDKIEKVTSMLKEIQGL